MVNSETKKENLKTMELSMQRALVLQVIPRLA